MTLKIQKVNIGVSGNIPESYVCLSNYKLTFKVVWPVAKWKQQRIWKILTIFQGKSPFGRRRNILVFHQNLSDC